MSSSPRETDGVRRDHCAGHRLAGAERGGQRPPVKINWDLVGILGLGIVVLAIIMLWP